MSERCQASSLLPVAQFCQSALLLPKCPNGILGHRMLQLVTENKTKQNKNRGETKGVCGSAGGGGGKESHQPKPETTGKVVARENWGEDSVPKKRYYFVFN